MYNPSPGHSKKCVRACKATVGKVRYVQSLGGCVQNDDRCVQDRSACVQGTCKVRASVYLTCGICWT